MSTMKNAFVAGGAGGIGEGIVKALLTAGLNVYVPTRKNDKSEHLVAFTQGSPGTLHLIPGDLGSEKSVVASLKQILKDAPSIDLVVVAVGSSFYGHSLHRIGLADWDRLLTENLATHYNVLHSYLGQLHQQNHGVYITLTGPEADFVHPETGLMSVVSAAQKMMTRVAAQEAAGTGVRVYSVTSAMPVATRARGEQVGADWLSPTELGEYVLRLATGQLSTIKEPLHVLESREQIEKLYRKS